jgi:hypothetical protein
MNRSACQTLHRRFLKISAIQPKRSHVTHTLTPYIGRAIFKASFTGISISHRLCFIEPLRTFTKYGSESIMASQQTSVSYSKPLHPTRPSFTSLPGEIRNIIYFYVLKLEPHTQLHYDLANNRIYLQNWCRHNRLRHFRKPTAHGLRDCLQSFKVLRGISQQVMHEAHTFFFYHNECVYVQVPDGRSYPPTIVSYTKFLQNIGADGRSRIRHLSFWGSSDYLRNSPPSLLDAKKFFGLLSQCTNLRFLQIRLDIESLCLGDLAALKNFLRKNGLLPIKGLRGFVKRIRQLKDLSELRLTVTVSKKYRKIAPTLECVQTQPGILSWMTLKLESFPNDRVQWLADTLETMLCACLRKTSGEKVKIKMMYDHIPCARLDLHKVRS